MITVIGRRWAHHHPHAATGRPQADFVDLLLGTLIYLREQTTLRRAAARVEVAKTTLNDAFGPLVSMLAEVGIAQGDGTLLHRDDHVALGELLAQMAAAGEVVLVDGVPTRCPRPGRSWAAQKPMYDSKHHFHAVNAQILTTHSGDLIAIHGGWPGSIHEATQLWHSHFAGAVRSSGVQVVTDAGYRAAREDFGVLARRGKPKTPAPADKEIALTRAEIERPHSLLKAWPVMDRTRIRGLVRIHTMTQAVAVLVGLQIYGHRVSGWPRQR